MKLWNCYAIIKIYGEIDSTKSYGIFTSREKALTKIYKEYRINESYTEDNYDYHWELYYDTIYESFNNKIYQQEITLKNMASSDDETICFIITEEEIDEGF